MRRGNSLKILPIISLRTVDMKSVYVTSAGLGLIVSPNFQPHPVATLAEQCVLLPRTAPTTRSRSHIRHVTLGALFLLKKNTFSIPLEMVNNTFSNSQMFKLLETICASSINRATTPPLPREM